MSVCLSLLAILSMVGGAALPLPAVLAAPAEISPAMSIPVSAPAPGPLHATLAVTGSRPMTGTIRIASLIASYFERQPEEILDLHAEGLGIGNITKALFTAAEAGLSLDEILEMRLQEIGWGEIRQALGLHPGMPRGSLGQIISQGQGGKAPDWMPPGQSKKMGGWTPPGQSRKGTNGPAPGGGGD